MRTGLIMGEFHSEYAAFVLATGVRVNEFRLRYRPITAKWMNSLALLCLSGCCPANQPSIGWPPFHDLPKDPLRL
jgi:hypothetical protein